MQSATKHQAEPPKNKQLHEIIQTNSSLRGEVTDMINKIDTLIDTIQPNQLTSLNCNQTSQHTPKSNQNKKNDDIWCLQNILDDLPIEQQIQLYQDSIKEIKSKIKISNSNIPRIEYLEYELRTKSEQLNNLHMQRDSLDKISSNYINAMKDTSYIS